MDFFSTLELFTCSVWACRTFRSSAEESSGLHLKPSRCHYAAVPSVRPWDHALESVHCRYVRHSSLTIVLEVTTEERGTLAENSLKLRNKCLGPVRIGMEAQRKGELCLKSFFKGKSEPPNNQLTLAFFLPFLCTVMRLRSMKEGRPIIVLGFYKYDFKIRYLCKAEPLLKALPTFHTGSSTRDLFHQPVFSIYIGSAATVYRSRSLPLS